MIGKRVQTLDEITQSGDYCLTDGYTGGKPAVFFIPPNVTPETLGTWPHGRLHHVTSPPHVFRECGDGSLEIRESIGCVRSKWRDGDPDKYSWHGYLDCGHVWRSV